MRPGRYVSRLLILILGLGAIAIQAAPPGRLGAALPRGIAWRVQGGWYADAGSQRLRAGDAVLPGSLLRPAELQGAHSITIFLPDGQRILNECFTEEDCARGFRVPALTETPTPFAVEMFRLIRPVLLRTPSSHGVGDHPSAPTTTARREEALSAIGPDGTASVSGLLSSLPNATYYYNLAPLDHTQSAQFHVVLHKTSSSCRFAVPGAGLYEISLWDQQNTPRINLFLAAVTPGHVHDFANYSNAKSLLAEWDEEYYGWPIHDFLRAYLQALMEAPSRARGAGRGSLH